MNDLDALKVEHATAAISRGHAGLNADPSASYYNIWSGRMLLISTKLKCNGDLSHDDIVALVRETDTATSQFGVRISLEKQNEILVLSLATGDVDGARQIAQINSNTDESHGFDIALNTRLRAYFCNTFRESRYNPTGSEVGFLEDLDMIASKRDTDLSGTDRYWSDTKSKRYANTAFGFKNLFHLAFEKLKGM